MNEIGGQEDPAYAAYKLARQALVAGDLKSAERLFTESLGLDEHFKTLELLGECFLRQNRVAEAITALRRAVFLGREAKAPLLLAQAYLTQNSFEEARQFLNESLARNPAYRPAQRMLDELPPLEAANRQRVPIQ